MLARRSPGKSIFSRRRNSCAPARIEGSRMDFDLSGKLALVTGSTRGIRLAACKWLAERGADVIVSGREKGAVDEAIAKLKPIAKGKSHAAAFDLGNADG